MGRGHPLPPLSQPGEEWLEKAAPPIQKCLNFCAKMNCFGAFVALFSLTFQ